MNIYIVCMFVLVSIVGNFCTWGKEDLDTRKYGRFKRALSLNKMKCNVDKDAHLDVSSVNIYFYEARKNEVKMYPIASAANHILNIPDLNIKRKFLIFVPGYNSHINKTTEKLVRDTFRGRNMHLIILDHSAYTNGKLGHLKSYKRSVEYVYYIGKALGEMLASLKYGGISENNMHCLGYFLGGQMLGYTGQTFLERTRTKLWRITALDPAGPCFSRMIEDQVRLGVAQYVEVYHCNTGGLVSSNVLADIDFFVNRKGTQSNCDKPLIPGTFDSSKAATCIHKTCVQVWTETVNHPQLAWQCYSDETFEYGECTSNVTFAGFWNYGNATGVYHFATED